MLHTEIIEKVRLGIEGRDEVLVALYEDQKLRRKVFGTLKKIGCPEDTADQQFVDAIINFTRSCRKENFVIKSDLHNYIVGTAKNLWRKQVTKQQKTTLLDENPIVSDNDTPLIILLNAEQKEPIRKLLSLLDAKCREVMKLWASNHKMTDIALQMDYKSEGMARKKKHHCKKSMYKIIEDHPELADELRDLL